MFEDLIADVLLEFLDDEFLDEFLQELLYQPPFLTGDAVVDAIILGIF